MIYSSVFVVLLSIISVGYYRPYSAVTGASESVSPISPVTDAPRATANVDEKTATEVTANFAMQTQMSVAANVANLSTSLEAQQEIAQVDQTVIAKPQIVQPTADSRTVSTYVAKTGDTAQSIAAEHGVSVETVKWANDLQSDAVEAGRDIVILPVDGVMYTTKEGDTAATLAETFGAAAERIVSFNDLEVVGIQEGMQIIIPGGVKPSEPAPVQPRTNIASSNGQTTGSFGGTASVANAGVSAGNRYAFGNCTSYAYERRAALGRPIGSFWGNASTWALNGAAAGFTVNKTPAPGAIAHWNSYSATRGVSPYYGHVGIVEQVNPDGTVTISEMNVAGFNVVSSVTLPASSVDNYIH